MMERMVLIVRLNACIMHSVTEVLCTVPAIRCSDDKTSGSLACVCDKQDSAVAAKATVPMHAAAHAAMVCA
jgi:hypothetical protein